MLKTADDLHTHTVYSHGKGTPEDNVKAAIAAGLERIAISEHGAGHIFYGVRGEKLKALRREIDRLNRVYGAKIQVLMGYEADLTAFGRCDLPQDRSMFDVTLLGYHKGVMPGDGLTARAAAESFGLAKGDPVKLAEGLLAACDGYGIDIISHPGEYARVDIAVLAKGAAELGVMLELNGKHVSMTAEEVKTAFDIGARICINSDAHSPQRVGDFKNALRIAETTGIEISRFDK